MLPKVCAPTEPAGELLPDAAAQLGLRAGIPVAPGAGDQHASALGLAIREGDAVFTIGTSGVVYTVSARPVRDPRGAVNGVADATGRFLPLVCTLNAAKVTDTFARLLRVDHAELSRLALAGAARPDRPVLAAYLDGERTPDRPGASGVLAGIHTDTSREEVAAAAYEGVLLGLLAGEQAIRDAGVPIGGRLLITGGGAASEAYRQLLADLSGRTVHLAAADRALLTPHAAGVNAAARGACVQAAAVLTEQDVTAVAEQWSPTVTPAASPRPNVTSQLVSERYVRLAAWTGMDLSTVGGRS